MKGKFFLPSGYKKMTKPGEVLGTVVWQVKHDATGEVLALKLYTEPRPQVTALVYYPQEVRPSRSSRCQGVGTV